MFGQLSKTKHKASLWSLRTHWKICSLCFWAGSSSHGEYNDIILIYPPEPAHHVLCSTKRISPESERFVANKACLLGTAPSQVSYVLPQAGKKDPSQLQRINHKVVKKNMTFLSSVILICVHRDFTARSKRQKHQNRFWVWLTVSTCKFYILWAVN